jgi:hypothetical protein
MVPNDINKLLTRAEVSVALTEAGYPCAVQTLCQMASRGDGPAFRKFGRRVQYRWGDALVWARGRVVEPGPGAELRRKSVSRVEGELAEVLGGLDE